MVRFTWDEAKNRANKAKHGVSFELARLVFDDPLQVSILEGHEHDEERWHTVGLVGSEVILLVVHTYAERNGEETVRIISARKATKRERAHYEQGV